MSLKKIFHTIRGSLCLHMEGKRHRRIHTDSIKELVSKNPYWRKGRVVLGHRYVEERNYLQANAEAVAARILSTTTRENAEANFISAKILVRKGEFETALNELQEMRPYVSLISIVEEEVACLVALERIEEAMQRIESLPKEFQTPELEAMKHFMMRRNDGTLYR